MSALLFDVKDLLRFERIASQLKLQIKSNMYLQKKWASGRTWNSLTPYAYETSSGLLEIGLKSSMPIPVNALETGRRPGKVPYGFDSIIYDWSIDKGIIFSTNKERWRFARAVAWKIRKSGTSQYRSGAITSIFTDIRPTYERKITDLVIKAVGSKVKMKLKFL